MRPCSPATVLVSEHATLDGILFTSGRSDRNKSSCSGGSEAFDGKKPRLIRLGDTEYYDDDAVRIGT